jgi:hypothetical protein
MFVGYVMLQLLCIDILCNVAAVMYWQFTEGVMLFPMLNFCVVHYIGYYYYYYYCWHYWHSPATLTEVSSVLFP